MADVHSTSKDPYREHGCHPDRVRRVWDQIGKELPCDCKCFIYGLPGLVTPTSGIILALAWGTNYILRVPKSAVAAALSANPDYMKYRISSFGVDPTAEFADDLILGSGIDFEPKWCLDAYTAYESGRGGAP
jgi:hypothetical protein